MNNTITKRLTALMALTAAASSGWAANAEQCAANAQELGARYQIVTEVHRDEHDGKHVHDEQHEHDVISRTNVLELWRHQGLVAHVHPQDQVAEIWNRVSDGRVRPIRYFDNDQRAIEYAPEDVNRGKGDHDWQGKNQLFTDAYLATLTLVSEQGSGCERTITYQQNDASGSTTLVWMPEMNLPKSFENQSGQRTTRWQLTSMQHDHADIEQVFDVREGYLSTDYADIGDNETDPFFRKLINLGFVSHGSSGFYNAEGEDIGGGHGHHH